jgi:serine/threonine protein kinase
VARCPGCGCLATTGWAGEAGQSNSSPNQATLAPGAAVEERIGGYEVLDELGRGGMGVVYRARQAGLGRIVALKMILAGDRSGTREQARFRTEAEAVARLQHPNIVQVFEVGEHQGRPFLSMEFCPAGSLDRKLAGPRCRRAKRLGWSRRWQGRCNQPTAPR